MCEHFSLECRCTYKLKSSEMFYFPPCNLWIKSNNIHNEHILLGHSARLLSLTPNDDAFLLMIEHHSLPWKFTTPVQHQGNYGACTDYPHVEVAFATTTYSRCLLNNPYREPTLKATRKPQIAIQQLLRRR